MGHGALPPRCELVLKMPFSISLRLFNKTIPKLQYAENAAESVEIHDLEVLKSQNIIRPQQVEVKLS